MSKFCKVCFDAGKDESTFKSHFVKSGLGEQCIVVCPTLLATECKYCHMVGHTVKYCNALKYKRRMSFVRDDVVKVDVTVKVNKNKMQTNMFDSLIESDSEDEVELQALAPVAAPTPAPVAAPVAPTPLQGWAAIAAKAPTAKAPTAKAPTAKAPKAPTVLKHVGKSFAFGKGLSRSWADWTDSDDEEDEDDMYGQTSVW